MHFNSLNITVFSGILHSSLFYTNTTNTTGILGLSISHKILKYTTLINQIAKHGIDALFFTSLRRELQSSRQFCSCSSRWTPPHRRDFQLCHSPWCAPAGTAPACTEDTASHTHSRNRLPYKWSDVQMTDVSPAVFFFLFAAYRLTETLIWGSDWSPWCDSRAWHSGFVSDSCCTDYQATCHMCQRWSTHKVGSIHDAILNRVSAVQGELQDLLLLLPRRLPDHLLNEHTQLWSSHRKHRLCSAIVTIGQSQSDQNVLDVSCYQFM